MSVSVVVPFRPDGGHRDQAWLYLAGKWAQRFPTWQVVTGDCPPGPWIKAHAVADALTRATGNILIIADADVWSDGVEIAAAAVKAGAPWAVPHGMVHRLDKPETERVLAGSEPDLTRLCRRPYRGVEGGGITVTTRTGYGEVPLDPRFAGWGSEDESHALGMNTLLGRRWRGTSPLVHLWHPLQPRLNAHIGSAPSRALHVRYQYAAGNPEAMRRLIDEFGANR